MKYSPYMDFRTEETSWMDLLKHPLFYLRVKLKLSECTKIINKIDSLFSPKLKIRYTFIQGKSGGIMHVNPNNFILKINPNEKNPWRLKRTILHELIHHWIGPDTEIGLSKTPNKYTTPREKLFYYLESLNKNAKDNFNKTQGNLTNSNYNETFEENLVNYAMMIILGDTLDDYKDLKYCFDNKTTDYQILSKIMDYLPDIRLSIEKLYQLAKISKPLYTKHG